jgi:hypothetical protein
MVPCERLNSQKDLMVNCLKMLVITINRASSNIIIAIINCKSKELAIETSFKLIKDS